MNSSQLRGIVHAAKPNPPIRHGSLWNLNHVAVVIGTTMALAFGHTNLAQGAAFNRRFANNQIAPARGVPEPVIELTDRTLIPNQVDARLLVATTFGRDIIEPPALPRQAQDPQPPKPVVLLPPELEFFRDKSDEELKQLMVASTRQGKYGIEITNYDTYWGARNLLEFQRGYQLSAIGLIENNGPDSSTFNGWEVPPAYAGLTIEQLMALPLSQRDHDRLMTEIMLFNLERRLAELRALPDSAWAGGGPLPGYVQRAQAAEVRNIFIEGGGGPPLSSVLGTQTELTPEQQAAYDAEVQAEIAILQADANTLQQTGDIAGAWRRRLWISILIKDGLIAYMRAKESYGRVWTLSFPYAIYAIGNAVVACGSPEGQPETPSAQPPQISGGKPTGGPASGAKPTSVSGGAKGSGETTVIINPVPAVERLPGLLMRLNQIAMKLAEPLEPAELAALQAEQQSIIRQIEQISGP